MQIDKIKVLQVDDKFEVGGGVGGIVRYFSTVFPKLSENYQVTVCSLSPEDKGTQYLRDDGFNVTCIAKGKFDVTKLFDLLRIIKSEQIDILHSHSFASADFCRLASLLTGVPVVVQQHFCHSVPGYQRFADALLRKVAVKVIAVSESVKRFMINKQFYNSDSIKVVYNGIDLELDLDKDQNNLKPNNLESADIKTKKYTEPSSNKASLRDEFSINPDDKIISTIGRLHYIKGQQILFAAIPAVVRKFPAITLVVVGEGELKNELERIAEEHGFSEKVKFIGFRNDVESIMEQSDVVVIPSLSDACPLAALEAMKCGCAIVASKVDGLAEMLSDRKNALLVPVKNTSDLASGILQLLNNSALAQKLGQQANIDVNKFSVQETANRISETYDEICKNRS